MTRLPLFIATSIALLAIPGPAVLFIVARSGSQGTRAGLISVLGVHVASAVHVLAAIAGLSALIVASAAAFTIVKIVGGLYLIGLGIRSIRAARTAAGTTMLTAMPAPRPPRQLFFEGLTVNLLNPKVALFFLAFLPQFMSRHHGPVWLQTLALGGIYIVLGLISDSLYAIAGARAGRWLGRRRRAVRSTRYAEGGVLVGLGVVTLALPAGHTVK